MNTDENNNTAPDILRVVKPEIAEAPKTQIVPESNIVQPNESQIHVTDPVDIRSNIEVPATNTTTTQQPTPFQRPVTNGKEEIVYVNPRPRKYVHRASSRGSNNNTYKTIMIVTIGFAALAIFIVIMGAFRRPPQQPTSPDQQTTYSDQYQQQPQQYQQQTQQQPTQQQPPQQQGQVGPNGEQPGSGQLGPNGEQPPSAPGR